MKKISARDILINTITEMVSKQVLEKITVQDILEETNISRPTFYKYFYDKQDLLEQAFKRELADPYFWDYSQERKNRENEFLKHLISKRNFFINAIQSQGQYSCYQTWLELAQESLYGYLRSMIPLDRISDGDLNFISKYLAYAYVNMIIDWLKNYDKVSPEELQEKLSLMMDFGLTGFLKDTTTQTQQDPGKC